MKFSRGRRFKPIVTEIISINNLIKLMLNHINFTYSPVYFVYLPEDCFIFSSKIGCFMTEFIMSQKSVTKKW
jgi:hypothetical protein